jgi:flagellar biosynthesis/type III secretory pathway M-ring protein FliF/YscJ
MQPQAHTPSRSSFPWVVGILVLFLLFWFLASELYVKRAAPAAAAPAAQERPSLSEFEAEAQRRLQETAVVDAANGRVRLDIERAKRVVVAEASE